MGRYNFTAQRVHQHATQLLERSRLAVPPPWFSIIGSTPPASRSARPLIQRTVGKGRKSKSRMFQPARMTYHEDKLRWDYFNDHPWDLARPRVILEDDGRDLEKWDWSVELDISLNRPNEMKQGARKKGKPKDGDSRSIGKWEQIWADQCGRPMNGESVVQRQLWLMKRRGLSTEVAYDMARKEYYRVQHHREIQRRVAHEEALAVGATFGPGPLEIGMKLEDRQYEGWRKWAMEEAEKLRQLQMQGSSVVETEAAEPETSDASSEESIEAPT